MSTPPPPSPPTGSSESKAKNLPALFYHRPTLKQEWADVSLVGGLLAILLFTSYSHIVPALSAFQGALSIDSASKLVNLFLATLPLALGITLTVAGFVRGEFNKMDALPLLLTIVAIFFVSAYVGAFLGLGSISGDQIDNAILWPSQHNINAGFFNFIFILAILLMTLYQQYGIITFLASVLLGCYASWAIFYKLYEHIFGVAKPASKP